ncbi:MFS transporter [Amnibacterium kyonggiense]|uniref:DHA3 family macrolide efflux protein-like MFS transporter n=1 Tax=Amnibacterium kyonggiense TaxID=595671 RepID=A0A4R7FIY8_9MICO|nr:MFS transporter [Amnibacterium kyonggiense]TDS75682.1 DHA3 family macrolide efflux protein-like MFS transporter [Amnibacterium kyonggiense]
MTIAQPVAWRRNAALFLGGQTISLFGSMVVQYAVMWYVTLQTRSAIAVALYAVAAFLPQGLVSIFGGTFADRVNRKALIIVSDTSTALATLGLAVLMLNGVTDLWVILVACAARSVGAGFQQPTVQAVIPQLVPEEQLLRINGLFQTIQSGLALLAPAVAGAVFGAFGIVPTFFLDVVTALLGVGVLLLVTVPTLDAVAGKTTGFRQDLVEGARFIWHHAFIRWLMVLFAVIIVLTGSPSFVTPLLITQEWGGDVWLLTVLELAFSIGMLLGGVAVSTVLAKRSRIRMIVLSSFGFGVFSLGLGVAPTLWAFYALMFLFGAMVPLFSAPFMTLVQEAVPPEKQGRVFSYVTIVMALSFPLGMVAFGPIADAAGVRALLVGTGVLALVVTGVAVLVPSGRRAMKAAAEGADPAETAQRVEAEVA